jgi:hypothetical protein
MPQSDGMDSATAFRLASGRFWEIVRLCPLIAGSRRPGRVEARADLEHPGQQRIRCFGGTRCFMYTNRTPDEWNKLRLTRERIAGELKEYYRVCTTGELPAQVAAKYRVPFICLCVRPPTCEMSARTDLPANS